MGEKPQNITGKTKSKRNPNESPLIVDKNPLPVQEFNQLLKEREGSSIAPVRVFISDNPETLLW